MTRLKPARKAGPSRHRRRQRSAPQTHAASGKGGPAEPSPGGHHSAAGLKTRAAILESVQRVLVERGVSGFSMRVVASDCSITVGNLQYYFPDLQTLVEAAIKESMEQYRQQFEVLLADLPLDSVDEYTNLMRWLVEDAFSPVQGRLFRCFYQLDSQYPAVSTAMTRLYEELTLQVAQRMKQSFPTVRRNKLREVAWLMALLTEGATVLGTEQQRSNRRFISQLVRLSCEAVRAKLDSLTQGKKTAPSATN